MKKVLLTISAILMLGSCAKELDNFPEVDLFLEIYPNTPKYFNLSSPGGWVYEEGGVNGLLIYRKNETEFIVYDRACSYKPEDACEQIEVENSGGFSLKDECCGSAFLITNGSIINGPAESPLRVYQNSYNGSSLRIWN